MKNQGLGRSIIKSRKGKPVDRTTSQLHNSAVADGPEWTKLGSITEQNDLDDLMTVAHLAGKEFIAERGSASVVHRNQDAPVSAEKKYSLPTDKASNEWIKIPRKPKWNVDMPKEELHNLEQASFLEWRRQIACIEESDHFILTPFERNLDIWRQLWRVVELSGVIVQIVDARNPDVFFCQDLVVYAKSVDESKKSILLLNKADLLTEAQRQCWASKLKEKAIEFIFFSALAEEEVEEIEDRVLVDKSPETSQSYILSREDLLTLFATRWKGCTIGLVGYPNVGKSSTINCLMGEKKVAVALTPGKTKHYQTLYLPNGAKICDCPGLVFPNFSISKSELVLNGILPVDQLRDSISPTALLAERIPRDIIERTYGIILPLPGQEDNPDRLPTAAEVLSTFAISRGFMTNHGNPDQSRAARIILKDYVSGKLLYAHAPLFMDEKEYAELTHSSQRSKLPVRSVPKPYKPVSRNEDEHLIAVSVGFVTKKPGNRPTMTSSKKHYKGKKSP